jgi:hypothetical protein
MWESRISLSVGVKALSKLSAKKENLDPAFLGENLEKLFAYIEKVRMEIAALNHG